MPEIRWGMTIPSNLQAEESGRHEHWRLCHSEAVSQEILKRTESNGNTCWESTTDGKEINKKAESGPFLISVCIESKNEHFGEQFAVFSLM